MVETQKKEENHALEWAWRRFGSYDFHARRLKTYSKRMQKLILALGILATFLALLQTELLTQKVFETGSWYKWAFQYSIVSLPIVVSILIASTNRFKPGYKCILLRAGAEAIKREIFRYRIHAEILKTENENSENFFNEKKIVEKINNINNRLMQTELNSTALTPYEGEIPPEYATGPDDDGFKSLCPKDYLKCRIEHQLNYYQNKTKKLETQLKRLNWLIYIFGGLGTFLAAIGLELWVALTTALIGVFTTYLEYRQVENTLMLYNQGATSLSEIKSGWDVLYPHEKKKKENILNLLENTEGVLLTEHSKWIQQMEEGLANLRSRQTQKEPEKKETPIPAQT